MAIGASPQKCFSAFPELMIDNHFYRERDFEDDPLLRSFEGLIFHFIKERKNEKSRPKEGINLS
jgi:hypothetical protein